MVIYAVSKFGGALKIDLPAPPAVVVEPEYRMTVNE
jgi:hypothetical protein